MPQRYNRTLEDVDRLARDDEDTEASEDLDDLFDEDEDEEEDDLLGEPPGSDLADPNDDDW